MEINLSTLLLQVANFIIMVFILARFLFKPLKETLEKRAMRVTQATDEAERAARESDALKREYEKKRDEMDTEFATLKNEARLVIEEARQQMLKEAYDEIEAMRARAQEELEQQRTEAMRLHRVKIGEVVTALVGRMVKDVLSPQLQQAYLDAFFDQLRSVQWNGDGPDDGEESVRAELFTATDLCEANETRVAAVLETVVSQPIDLSCRVDPDLIAGAMVRLGDLLVDGSLQGQIEHLRSRYEAQIG
ncbi:MAG: F0F1 ATP synthase subunit delta [Anaerolineae bacterium]|nr:F0F1 ATP synthase subunit delta [Anaerolineae bacterium]